MQVWKYIVCTEIKKQPYVPSLINLSGRFVSTPIFIIEEDMKNGKLLRSDDEVKKVGVISFMNIVNGINFLYVLFLFLVP